MNSSLAGVEEEEDVGVSGVGYSASKRERIADDVSAKCFQGAHTVESIPSRDNGATST